MADQESQPTQPQDSPAAESQPDPQMDLQKERDDLFSRLQRLSADYQNFQRRSEQNLADSVTYARGDVLRLFIPVLDHFDTAISHKPESADGQALYQGVELVRNELLKVLQQAGVERVEVKPGEPFDPHRHEAMMRQPVEGVPPHHVTMCMQPGYVYRGRTLRAAKVAVAPE